MAWLLECGSFWWFDVGRSVSAVVFGSRVEMIVMGTGSRTLQYDPMVGRPSLEVKSSPFGDEGVGREGDTDRDFSSFWVSVS